MNIKIKRFNLVFLVFAMFSFVAIAEDKVPTVHGLLDSSGLDIDYKKIDAGEIVIFDREDQERSDTSIALSMGLYVKAPYETVVKELKKGQSTLSNYKNAMFIDIKDVKNIKKYISKVGFCSDEKDEVEKLYGIEDGDDTFNLNKDEVKKWHLMIKEGGKSIDVASSFMRYVLIKRLNEYIKGGIGNISSYNRCGDKIEIGKDFKSSSMGLRSMRKWFPQMYKDYMNYPNVVSNGYQQNFFVIKDIMDDRVVFILKHQMVKEQNNMLLIAERQFYISHGLDAIATQIVCLPYKDGTMVALSSQSFTEKVAGFGRKIALKIGRHMMAKEILPMFESLQKKFNH
jgi:hypothetical protein